MPNGLTLVLGRLSLCLKIVGGVFELPYHLDMCMLGLLTERVTIYHQNFIMFIYMHTL